MAKKQIITDIADLLLDVDSSSLNASLAAGVSEITVYSISSFAINQALLVGELGNETSEIVFTHISNTPSGNSVYLNTSLIKPHSKDTKVYIINYNQIEYSWSATTTGTKTVLDTVSINPERKSQLFEDSTKTTGYYFTRFYNSTTLISSDYSDPMPYEGAPSNTVGYMINMAMSELNKDFTDTLTFEMLLNEINSCLRFVRGKLKRWSNTQKFNYELDATLVTDDYTWTLPTDYYDPNSNKSMLRIWLEDQAELEYVDKREYDDYKRAYSDAGTPKYYTVYDGSVYIVPKVSSDYAADSIYMDYYTDISEIDSESDVIDLARHDMIKHWLKWMIRNTTENNGKLDYQDGDWQMFQQILADAIRREASGQKFKLKPFVSGINYGTVSSNNFDTE